MAKADPSADRQAERDREALGVASARIPNPPRARGTHACKLDERHRRESAAHRTAVTRERSVLEVCALAAQPDPAQCDLDPAPLGSNPSGARSLPRSPRAPWRNADLADQQALSHSASRRRRRRRLSQHGAERTTVVISNSPSRSSVAVHLATARVQAPTSSPRPEFRLVRAGTGPYQPTSEIDVCYETIADYQRTGGPLGPRIADVTRRINATADVRLGQAA